MNTMREELPRHSPQIKHSMQLYNNILAIEANWLIEQGIMSQRNYGALRDRQDLQVVRRGCRGQEALVSFESLPERFKRKVLAIVPNPYKAVQVNMVESFIEHSAEVSAFFDGYRLGDDKHLPVDKRREYYMNAIVLEGIGRLIAQRAAKRRALGHTSVRFWSEIADAVQDLDRSRYPHALPANARSLERRYKQYKAEGYESLIHKAFLSSKKNAAKVADEKQESLLVELIGSPNNLDNAQVAKIYNSVADVMSWKQITSSTVAVWRDKVDSITFARRRGSREYNNQKTMQVKRSAPTYPLYYWTTDGWDVELMYQRRTTNKDGKQVTIFHEKVTMVIVLDACCKYPIGYAIGDYENPNVIKEALRNAAKHTEELFGQMYRTQQIQSDNYGRGALKPSYVGISGIYTPAKVGNAKAKIIEPWFRYFNKKYCQMQKNWSGYGVTSKKELQPNSEYLNKYKKEFPDFAGVCEQVVRFLEMERRELRDKYMALFNEMPAEKRIPLPFDQYLMLYGTDNGKRQLLQGNGLTLTIAGKQYQYDCFDHDFRDHASTRWQVRYDPDDMRKVLAVNEDETLHFVLEEKYIQPMALVERKEGDYKELQRVFAFNERQSERISRKLGKHAENVDNLLNSRKELANLQKFLITDSTGQHKNQRNKVRLQVSDAEVVEEEEKRNTEIDLYDEY
ncbi:MAG: hypothetical protein NC038_05615 [Paludibacter sp.]|nr:hypothetical protein [Bacteroidales bacterium]MCM1069850.1 hypothetical protein [Prevotella sp.]MCM1353957.1 hypothetical protein [Bacteroides sp.]MCM1443401.1 hypothetical protein [Muribaculum sp.]MCM1482104.1 hypothetical protein [Paludibacter sp.]